MPQAAQRAPLPPLREELAIHPGPRAADGSPTWVLEDPASGRYFSLSWLEFEVLSRWSLGSLEAIARALERETTLPAGDEALQAVLGFLGRNSLLQVSGDQALERMGAQARAVKPDWARWLLKNYLFMRVPLLRPGRFLEATLPWVAGFFRPGFGFFIAACALLGAYLAGRQWDSFVATFPHFFSLYGALAMAAALTLAKVVHELGHAYTAVRHGCKVPTMGVALLVLWPVLYTDTTAAWKLPTRRQRLAVGAAGMLAEMSLAACALLAWSFLPDGPLRSAAFLLASSTWVLTLAVNLNPLMRFDGYYLLSDALGISNLQDRAFAYGRWQLRQWLFALGDAPPEFLPARTRRVVLVYAYATWAYRFFLFLGIALLVYHFFFKLLGIFLWLVEMVWFIGLPIYRELKAWSDRKSDFKASPRAWITGLAVTGGLMLLFVPWRGDVSAPALSRAGEYTRVFAKIPARIDRIHVREGERVQAGQPMFELSSPDLDFAIVQGRRQLERLSWEIQNRGLNADLLARSKVAMAEYQSEYATLQSRLAEHATLQVRSPGAGVVRDLRPELRPGDWVGSEEVFAVLVDDGDPTVEAFVEESDLARIAEGADAVFYAADLLVSPIALTVTAIDRTNTAALHDAYLASNAGGEIAVRVGRNGQLVPDSSLYKVRLRPLEGRLPARILSGTVVIHGEREVLALRELRRAWTVLVRESGF